MRTIKNLQVPQEENFTLFPDGQIKNETPTEAGTPVVREVYGDVLANIYALLRQTGVEATQTEDSETSQYQIIDALKVFANKLNDIRQVVTVSQNSISLPVNIDNLPDNYIFIGKLTDALISTENYTINSTGNNSYPLSVSENIPASSLVLIIVNQSSSEIFSFLSSGLNVSDTINVTLGNPLSFNDSSDMYYFSDGIYLNNFPLSFSIENQINAVNSTSDIRILQSIVFKGKLLIFTLNQSTLNYKMYAYSTSDLSTLEGEVTIPIDNTSNNNPYMYCDGNFIYFTNSSANINSDSNNNSLSRFIFDENLLSLTLSSSFVLEPNFVKSTNVFIDSINEYIYTLINGDLYRHEMNSNNRVLVSIINNVNANVFRFNSKTYYSSGDSAIVINF